MNSLTNGATSLVLPSDLLWADEFAWAQVEQRKAYSITGALLVESKARLKGRGITLAGGDAAWIRRVDVLTLKGWQAVAGLQLSLVLRDEPARLVIFDHEAGALEATPLIDYSAVDPQDYYHRLTLRFLEV